MGTKPAKVDAWYVEMLAILIGLAGAFFGRDTFTAQLGKLLTTEQSAVYGAITGLQGAFLGFVLAALTIVLGYSRSPELQFLRDSQQLGTLMHVYLAGIRAHALSTITALVALLMHPAAELGPYAAWVVGCTSLLAFLRLFRTLWATKAVVLHVASASAREAGDR